MGLGPSLSIRQSQSLVLTPQLAQAIKLLQLSNLELEAYLAEELAKNPLLESRDDDDGGEAPIAEASSDGAGAEDEESGDPPEGPGADDLILARAEDDRPLDRDWDSEALETDSVSDLGDVGGSGASGEGFDFDRLEYAAGSLSEHLIGQLHGASGAAGNLARMIAEMIEETGYLTVPLGDIAAATGAPLALVEQALALVQNLEPPGVGARSLAECLALQAKSADRYDPAMARMIDNLELLAKGRTQDLKRICAVDDEDLADMIRELRGYDPKPGCQFAKVGDTTVTPDVFVR